MACFTDAVMKEITKYHYGWSMIALIIINMIVNLAVFLKACCWSVYLIGLKYYRRYQKWRKDRLRAKYPKWKKPNYTPEQLEEIK